MPATPSDTVGALANLDRARVYRALAKLFLPPDPESLDALRAQVLGELRESLARLGESRAVRAAAESLRGHLSATDPAGLRSAYQWTFEASGARCPPHETAHPAEPPGGAGVRAAGLADVQSFYRAFGVEPTPGSERPDHISAELEFMQLLAAKEAVALGDEGEGERAVVCREAARVFLRDHLGRFVERFADAVEAGTREPFYRAAARLLAGFVAHDAARVGVEWAPTPPLRPRPPR